MDLTFQKKPYGLNFPKKPHDVQSYIPVMVKNNSILCTVRTKIIHDVNRLGFLEVSHSLTEPIVL